VKITTQTAVGFIIKIKIDKANNPLIFSFLSIISLSRINEKTITGKSGLGDWLNRNKIGKNNK